jgi:hypothetical protein
MRVATQLYEEHPDMDEEEGRALILQIMRRRAMLILPCCWAGNDEETILSDLNEAGDSYLRSC